jgi:hypothetical protein
MKYLLIAIAVSLVACTSGESSKGICAPTHAFETVMSSLTLPTAVADGSFDIDGDGKNDNALAAVINALNSGGLGSQDSVDNAINAGISPLLIEVDSNDAALANDSCAEVTFGVGAALPTIALDGSDHITIDTSVATVTIGGELRGNVFTSDKPSGKPNPLQMLIDFANTPVRVPINAAHVSFTVDAVAGTITGGKIGGAMLLTDVQNTFLPALGAQLTAQVAAAQDGSAQIESLFDTGGTATAGCNKTCKEPSTGKCAVAGDRQIDGCEINGNSLLHALLQPDVSILDSDGNIAPDHERKPKDAVSLGLSFQAVAATY